ncbi:Gfo/Idh/MocA family oxidoreductase [Candidatus Poribacteria bacterium]|nr:Gfo/Idh/MocA family oxidoreductase [Candidatus Poribacteria bacterium]
MALKLGILGLEEHFPYVESGIKQARELFDIVGIVDNYEWNRERRDALAAEFATPVMKDWKQLIDAGAQLITVCMINNEKGPVICECLKQGIHVVADKPTVATRADYEAVKTASASSPETILSTLFTLRADGAHRRVIQMVADGAVGEVASFYALRSYPLRPGRRIWWLFDETKSGGFIIDLMTHDVDLMRQIVGPDAKLAAASQAKFTHEVEGNFQDVCQMLFVYPSGAGAIIEGNRLVSYESSDCRLKVAGSKGVVEINRFPDGLRILTHTAKGFSEVAPAETGTHLLINVVQHILGDADLIVTTEDSLEASRLCIEATEMAQVRNA